MRFFWNFQKKTMDSNTLDRKKSQNYCMQHSRIQNNRKQHWLAGLGILAGTAILLLFLVMAADAATNIWPALGAGAVDLPRGILGDKPVSQTVTHHFM